MVDAIKARKEVYMAEYNFVEETIKRVAEDGTVIEEPQVCQELLSPTKEIEASFFTCPNCGLEGWTTAPVGTTFNAQCGRCSNILQIRVVS